ncbi:hypothetical protein [Neorhizobium galegae]|nr:hypothetical protein [Neorhizobium galegae]
MAATQRELLDSLHDWQTQLIMGGHDPYVLTLMFNPIGGGEKAIMRAMVRETELTYARLLTRLIKKPKRTPVECMPMLFAWPDWPVHKNEKISLNEASINGGAHIQGLFLIPQVSRAKKDLSEIVGEKQDQFAGPNHVLARLHAVRVDRTHKRVQDYLSKFVKRGRTTMSDLIVLPRTHTEMDR